MAAFARRSLAGALADDGTHVAFSSNYHHGCECGRLQPASNSRSLVRLNRAFSRLCRLRAVPRQIRRHDRVSSGPSNVLWRQPDHVLVLKNLYRRANLAGKLYALVGLYDTHPQEFARLARKLKRTQGSVVANNGCYFSSVAIADILTEIENGSLTAAFRKVGAYMTWHPDNGHGSSANNRLKLPARGRPVADGRRRTRAAA